MRKIYFQLSQHLGSKLNIDLQYFLHGGSWLSLMQIITILLGILTSSFFAHYLSETDYGVYRYLIGLAVLFSSFSLTGLGQSIIQTAAKKYYGFYQETLRLNFFYSLSITIIGLVGTIYYFINDNIILSLGCVLIAIFQPIINAFQNTPSFLQGSHRYKESTFSQGIKVLFVSLTSITALYFTQSILILFFVYLATSTLITVAVHLIYRPRQALHTPPEVYTKYVSYAKNTSARNIIASISNRLDTVLIFTQLGAAELAIYSIATIIPEQIKASFKNLASLLLPKYAKHENVDVLKRSVLKRSLQLLIILSAITVFYIIAAPYVYSLLFPKYQEAVFLSQIAALAFPTFILLIPYTILQAQLAEKQLFRITMYSSLFQIVVQLLFIFSLGIIGAILARITYRLFLLMIIYYELYKK